MKWEYKIVFINALKWNKTGLPNDLNLKFDELGEDGWELVKIEPKLDGGFILFGIGVCTHTVGYTAFFKRAKN